MQDSDVLYVSIMLFILDHRIIKQLSCKKTISDINPVSVF